MAEKWAFAKCDTVGSHNKVSNEVWSANVHPQWHSILRVTNHYFDDSNKIWAWRLEH